MTGEAMHAGEPTGATPTKPLAVLPTSADPSSLREQDLSLVLDTNVYESHWFSLSLFDKIEELASSFRSFKLIVPETVFRECRHRYEERTKPKPLQGPAELMPKIRDWESRIAKEMLLHGDAWQARIRKLGDVRNASDAVLRAAYERLMAKRPPCHSRDESRDAVIWEVALAEAASGRKVVFVSANTKDLNFDHPELKRELESAGIIWVRQFNDLYDWLAPLRLEIARPKPHEAKYALSRPAESNSPYDCIDFEDETRQAIEEALPNYLMGLTAYFNWDVEVYELSRDSSDVSEVKTGVEGLRQFSAEETWQFSVSFSLEADIRVGGSDGLELSPTGKAEATGTAVIRRDFTIMDDGDLQQTATVSTLSVDYDDDWDPYMAIASGEDD